jgi:hypothetical protein
MTYPGFPRRRASKAIGAAGLLLFGTALLTGCNASPHTQKGIATGTFLLGCGPPSCSPTPIPGTVTFEQVVNEQIHGQIVRVGHSGRFHISLRAGHWLMYGYSPRYKDSQGNPVQCQGGTISIKSGLTTHTQLFCPRF